MLDFVRRYRDKPDAKRAPLFSKVVQNRITDAHRRRSVRNRIWSWFGDAPQANKPTVVRGMIPGLSAERGTAK